jgi:hypothetical protein
MSFILDNAWRQGRQRIWLFPVQIPGPLVIFAASLPIMGALIREATDWALIKCKFWRVVNDGRLYFPIALPTGRGRSLLYDYRTVPQFLTANHENHELAKLSLGGTGLRCWTSIGTAMGP